MKNDLLDMYEEEKERLQTLDELSEIALQMVKNESFKDYVDIIFRKYVEILDAKEEIRDELQIMERFLEDEC